MVQINSAAGLTAMVSSVLFISVNGHMIMKTPYPYGPATLNNSPLDGSGSDFPCKLRGDSTYAAPTQANNFAIGESQTLSFTGSAVHGGGSCQVSLSTDKEPTASSSWQVIHSIQGGCPAAATGNLADGTSTDSTFQFSIPESVSPGEYTLAWTWFNKIGNREMYMNCAPVTVAAAKKRRYAPSSPATSKRAAALPAMAVANVKSVNTCATVEGTDVAFPDPGDSLETSSSSFKEGNFVGDGCPLAVGASSSSSGSTGSTGSSAANPSASALTQSSAGVFAPSSTASTPVAATSAAAASVEPVASSVAPVASSAVQSSPSSSSTGTASSGSVAQGASCTAEGSAECTADGQSYLICASGYWQSMPVAAGTKCDGTGVQASVNIVALNQSKRHAHAREHLRRHGHA